MILTLCYAYATIMQWWRLRTLTNKLNGTLNAQNALLLCSGSSVHHTRQHRSLENLLFKHENRIACTIVPKQKLNLNQWIAFPKNLRYFPIHIDEMGQSDGRIYVLMQAVLEQYVRHRSDVIQVEAFGELIGWKAGDCFELVVRTDITRLAKLVNLFSHTNVDINHDLALLKVETVDVEGLPTVIKYDKKYLKEQTLKYSYAPAHWTKFASELKELYAKIRDITNPKIKIENGSTKCFEGCVKPKKVEDKNTLDVTSTEHRRHKKREVKVKPDKKVKNEVQKVQRHKKVNKLVKQSSVKDDIVDAKPPNVLVYADSVITRDNVKKVLSSILNKEKYTIYDLPATSSWCKTTSLVVVCGGVPPDLTSNLITYFLSGGRLLCLCSDLMYNVLYTFTTAEVREHELVRFSYGPWERVKMMHHIFCYQASPAKKQFSKDSDHSNHSSNGSSPLAPRTPSNVEMRHNEKDYSLQVQVLGTEETWQTPSLLLAKVKSGSGRAVFSQVHLEIDPEQYENDEKKYRELLSSNETRMEIFRDLLARHLGVECDERREGLDFTCGYFLGRFDAKMALISDCDSIAESQLRCDKVTVTFHSGESAASPPPSDVHLPVHLHSCPPTFSTLAYFDTLATNEIGRLVVYSDVMTSTHHLLARKLAHGLAVVAKQQTSGMGRSQNTWLTPIGCAAFSLQLHVGLATPLGRSLPLVQHLVMVAVIQAVENQGFDELDLRIKWPNDLYVGGATKIGGVIVTSLMSDKVAVVNIGCGVNLSNQNPTLCINQLIERDSSQKPIQYEKYFALVFNEIERLYQQIQTEGLDFFFELYYKYWLHSDVEVTIQNDKNETRKAKVVGIDEFGFLRVRLEDGAMTSVQPDGNSFDMMSGLIAPKQF